jgi:uncharacterized iron-regulated protein
MANVVQCFQKGKINFRFFLMDREYNYTKVKFWKSYRVIINFAARTTVTI